MAQRWRRASPVSLRHVVRGILSAERRFDAGRGGGNAADRQLCHLLLHGLPTQLPVTSPVFQEIAW